MFGVFAAISFIIAASFIAEEATASGSSAITQNSIGERNHKVTTTCNGYRRIKPVHTQSARISSNPGADCIILDKQLHIASNHRFLCCSFILHVIGLLSAHFVLLAIVLLILDSNEGMWNMSANALQSRAVIQNLYDNFDGGIYSLNPGNISPNGKWQDLYTGYGVAGVAKDSTGNHYFFETPKMSTSTNETHASLAITTKNYSNFDMTISMNTVKQLRQGSPPNSWETAWMYWHYTDEFHWYAFYLKPTGFQIEKKDNSIQNDSAEIYLVNGETPKLQLGHWTNVRISMIGSHIIAWINGIKIADFRDKIPNSEQMYSGAMGLYSEDASVGFHNLYIKALQ